MWSFDVTCGFVRFPPGGAPVVLGHRLPWADRLVPDRSGGMWFTSDLEPGGGHIDATGRITLASRVRLQRTTLGAPAAGCDDRPPRVQIKPNAAKRVSLAALRRNRGFTITVREPFAMESFVTDPGEDPFSGADAVVTNEGGRTVRVPISQRKLRQLARRKNPRPQAV